MKVKIKTGNIELEGELNDSESARGIYEKLPIKGVVRRWGDEIYFKIPLHVDLEEGAKEVVDKGDLGFWPEGDCFCIFFGKTPASQEYEIRAASAVNIFGKIVGDASVLRNTRDGDEILVEKA